VAQAAKASVKHYSASLILVFKKFPDCFFIRDKRAQRFFSHYVAVSFVVRNQSMAWRMQIVRDSCDQSLRVQLS
jgi:hypothetical protein